MSVSDVMSRWLVTVNPKASVREAAKAMNELGVGSVLVVDDNGRLVGIFTERDLVRVVAEGGSLDDPVERHMSRRVISVEPGTPLLEASDTMIRHGIRHLPVVDREGRPLGVLSLRDLCQRLLGELGD